MKLSEADPAEVRQRRDRMRRVQLARNEVVYRSGGRIHIKVDDDPAVLVASAATDDEFAQERVRRMALHKRVKGSFGPNIVRAPGG